MRDSRRPAGNGDPKVVISVTTNDKRRWVHFRAAKEPVRTSDLPLWLNRALIDWQEVNPSKRVRSSLGIVSNGMTVAIHIWYEESGSVG